MQCRTIYWVKSKDDRHFKFLFSQHRNFPRRSSFSPCHSASCLRNPSFGLAMLLRSLTYAKASVNDISLLEDILKLHKMAY